MKMKMNIARNTALALASVGLLACAEHQTAPTVPVGDGIAFAVEPEGSAKSAAPSRTPSASLCLGEETEGSLYLHASSDWRNSPTRGTERTTANFYDAFGVVGYKFTGSWNETLMPNLMYNERATWNGLVWQTHTKWPDTAESIRFYAYAPHPADAQGIGITAANHAGAPQISYTVPADVEQQADLLATVCTEDATAGHPDPQTLQFHPLLTAVRFCTGAGIAPGTIDRITLKNIKYKGTYSYPATADWSSDRGTWDVSDDMTDFTIACGYAVDGTSGLAVNGEDQVLFMLPQTLTDLAEAEIRFTDSGGVTSTYTAKLKSLASWKPCQTVTYSISTDPNALEYVLKVEPGEGIEAKAAGGDSEYRVVSYKQEGGVITPLAWSVVGYSADGKTGWTTTRPSWLTTMQESGTGSKTPAAYTAVTEAMAITGSDGERPNAATFAGTQEVGTAAEPYDLSLHNIDGTANDGQTTANCYVIRQPGHYKLPLVYGNARKNGMDNTLAYTGTPCVDYQDQPISSPYIYQQTNVDGAVLQWETSDGLVTDVTTDGQWLYFTITPENICQGNALVSVKSGTEVVWSWHLWITHEALDNTHPLTYGSYTFDVMPVNLGWTADPYEDRVTYVKFRQEESNLEVTMAVKQVASEMFDYKGLGTYYQWGRPSPFYLTMYEKENLYIGDGTRKDPEDYQFKTIGEALCTPATFYYMSESPQGNLGWTENDLEGQWNAGGTFGTGIEYYTRKSIYDPCPPGYVISSPIMFLNHTWTDGEDDHRGRSVTCDDGTQLFFPAHGQINSYSGDFHNAWWACYWTAQNTAKDYDVSRMDTKWSYIGGMAIFFQFYNNNNAPVRGTYGTSRGMNIRPVKEKK